MRKDIQEKLNKHSSKNYEIVATRMRTAANIADAMAVVGMTNADLARKMGKSPSEITKWLSGTHNFTIDSLTEISDALGIEITTSREPVSIYQVADNSYHMNTLFSDIVRSTRFKIPKRQHRFESYHYSFC